MALIKKIILKDVSIEISPSGDVYQGFFGIDSIHLILGKNGSGKTTILQEIARMVGKRSGEIDIILQDRSGDMKMMGEANRLEHGAVFYTALPYRRKISTSLRVVDASPHKRDEDTPGSYEVFKHISRQLGVDASLTGSVGFSSSLFTEVLNPALMEIRNPELLTPELYALRQRWLRDTPSLELSENLTLSQPVGHLVSMGDHEISLRAFRTRSASELRKILLDPVPELVGLVELAVLEKMAVKSQNKPQLGLHFLAFKRMFDAPFDKNAEAFFDKFEETVRNTLNYIWHLQDVSNQRLPQKKRDSISFPIDSQGEVNHILRLDSAINIHWMNLSSGLRALIEQFSRIRGGIEKLQKTNISNILLMIDEGDAFLHLDWQRQYVDLLDRYLTALKIEFKLESLQVILTTHSPVIATDFPGMMVTNLDAGIDPIKTFAAPLDDIALNSFGSNAIGSFAAKKIDELQVRLTDGSETATDVALVREIGDIFIQNALLRISRNLKS